MMMIYVNTLKQSGLQNSLYFTYNLRVEIHHFFYLRFLKEQQKLSMRAILNTNIQQHTEAATSGTQTQRT